MITHLKIENNVNITEYIDTNILDLMVIILRLIRGWE